MSRISIDVTAEEHQKLKAIAALQGQSIKEFVLARTLGSEDEGEALAQLETMLDERQRAAVSDRTVGDIFEQAYAEVSGGKNG